MRRHAKASSARPTSNRAAAALAVLACLAVLGPLASSAVALPVPPPGRGYELVSHADMNGNYPGVPFVFNKGRDPLNIARADGERLLFMGFPVPGVAAVRGIANYMSKRTAAGWIPEYVGAPGDRVDVGQLALFSPDLAKLLYLVPGESKPLGGVLDPADADERDDYYVRHENGTFTLATPTPFEPEPSSEAEEDEPKLRAIATGGGTWTYLSKKRHFSSHDRMWVYTPAGPELVSILPEGEVSTATGLDSLGSTAGGELSPDGNRVVFRSRNFGNEGPYRIWVRIRDEERTVLASGPEPGVGSETLEAKIDAFSTDGSAVLFTTAQQLTLDDTDEQVDLYRFDIDAEDTELVSAAGPGAPSDGNAEACEPTYGVSGCAVSPGTYSADGTTAYFVSPEQLDEGATKGAPNLYVHREGATRLVGVLANGDVGTGEGGWRIEFIARRPVRVTPVGDIAFESRAKLTAYDNEGAAEIYLYDAESGQIECASCAGGPAFGPNQAAALPSKDQPFDWSSNDITIQGRNLANGGAQVFFETAERLVARDINGKSDVYEYDSTSGGIELISSGTGVKGSYYLDSSADGEDVFFISADLLVPPEQDENGETWKIFDARRGGGFPEKAAGGCGADCRAGESTSPGFVAPASGLLSSAGNVRARRACGAAARRALRLSRRAKSLRRRARRAPGKHTRRLRHRADAYAKRAHRLSRQAKRCRGNDRRASR